MSEDRLYRGLRDESTCGIAGGAEVEEFDLGVGREGGGYGRDVGFEGWC